MADPIDTPVNLNESLDIALNAVKGKVVMLFPRHVPHVVFDPQNAFSFAEQLARTAHRAAFPNEKLPDDFSYLAQQLKQRLTDDMRDRLLVRIRSMLPSLMEKKDLNYASAQIVDTIFSALDTESFTKLDPKGSTRFTA